EGLQARSVAARDAGEEGAERHAGEHAERAARSDTLHLAEQVEERPLLGTEEAEQLDRVLAHLGVDEETHRDARGWQVGEGLERDLDRVAHAADLEHEPLRALLAERARERGDHAGAPAAASTAPRASPRRNALCTLRATKARSRTTAAGSHAAIRRRHSACRRARRAPRSPAGASTIVPLARWRKPPPRASTTPQPVSRLPGSIPSTRTPAPPPAPAVGSRRQPLQLLRRDVHVRRHALHVVVVLERFQQPHHLLGLLAGDG